MGKSPLHALVLGVIGGRGDPGQPCPPLRVGLECRPPGLSAKAAGRADPGCTRLSGLTLSSTRRSLGRKMWPGSFPRECSRILLSPPFFHSRRCTCQPAPTSPLRVTKDVPAQTRLHWFQRATSPSPPVSFTYCHTHVRTHSHATRVHLCHTIHVCRTCGHTAH